jgi:DNA replication regulator DPB11
MRLEDVMDGSAFEMEERAEEGPQEVKDNHEPAPVKKRKREAMESLVGDLISTRTTKVSPALPDPDEEYEAERQVLQRASTSRIEREPTVIIEATRKPSMLQSISRSESFAARPTAGTGRVSSRLSPVRRTSPARNTVEAPAVAQREPSAPPHISADVPPNAKAGPSGVSSSPQFFAGLRFSHDIKESSGGLEKALVTHGAELVSEQRRLAGEDVDYVVIRLCVWRVLMCMIQY